MQLTTEQEKELRTLYQQGIQAGKTHEQLESELLQRYRRPAPMPTVQGPQQAPMTSVQGSPFAAFADPVEQPEPLGGVAGAVLDFPAVKHPLWLVENLLYEPVSTFVGLGLQGMIPGEQGLQKAWGDAAEKAGDEGKGFIGKSWSGYQAATEADIWKPFEGKSFTLPEFVTGEDRKWDIPEWLVGKDKTLSEIGLGLDVGRFVAELPADIVTFGAGKIALAPIRAARAASKVRKGRLKETQTYGEGAGPPTVAGQLQAQRRADWNLDQSRKQAERKALLEQTINPATNKPHTRAEAEAIVDVDNLLEFPGGIKLKDLYSYKYPFKRVTRRQRAQNEKDWRSLFIEPYVGDDGVTYNLQRDFRFTENPLTLRTGGGFKRYIPLISIPIAKRTFADNVIAAPPQGLRPYDKDTIYRNFEVEIQGVEWSPGNQPLNRPALAEIPQGSEHVLWRGVVRGKYGYPSAEEERTKMGYISDRSDGEFLTASPDPNIAGQYGDTLEKWTITGGKVLGLDDSVVTLPPRLYHLLAEEFDRRFIGGIERVIGGMSNRIQSNIEKGSAPDRILSDTLLDIKRELDSAKLPSTVGGLINRYLLRMNPSTERLRDSFVLPYREMTQAEYDEGISAMWKIDDESLLEAALASGDFDGDGMRMLREALNEADIVAILPGEVSSRVSSGQRPLTNDIGKEAIIVNPDKWKTETVQGLPNEGKGYIENVPPSVIKEEIRLFTNQAKLEDLITALTNPALPDFFASPEPDFRKEFVGGLEVLKRPTAPEWLNRFPPPVTKLLTYDQRKKIMRDLPGPPGADALGRALGHLADEIRIFVARPFRWLAHHEELLIDLESPYIRYQGPVVPPTDVREAKGKLFKRNSDGQIIEPTEYGRRWVKKYIETLQERTRRSLRIRLADGEGNIPESFYLYRGAATEPGELGRPWNIPHERTEEKSWQEMGVDKDFDVEPGDMSPSNLLATSLNREVAPFFAGFRPGASFTSWKQGQSEFQTTRRLGAYKVRIDNFNGIDWQIIGGSMPSIGNWADEQEILVPRWRLEKSVTTAPKPSLADVIRAKDIAGFDEFAAKAKDRWLRWVKNSEETIENELDNIIDTQDAIAEKLADLKKEATALSDAQRRTARTKAIQQPFQQNLRAINFAHLAKILKERSDAIKVLALANFKRAADVMDATEAVSVATRIRDNILNEQKDKVATAGFIGANQKKPAIVIDLDGKWRTAGKGGKPLYSAFVKEVAPGNPYAQLKKDLIVLARREIIAENILQTAINKRARMELTSPDPWPSTKIYKDAMDRRDKATKAFTRDSQPKGKGFTSNKSPKALIRTLVETQHSELYDGIFGMDLIDLPISKLTLYKRTLIRRALDHFDSEQDISRIAPLREREFPEQVAMPTQQQAALQVRIQQAIDDTSRRFERDTRIRILERGFDEQAESWRQRFIARHPLEQGPVGEADNLTKEVAPDGVDGIGGGINVPSGVVDSPLPGEPPRTPFRSQPSEQLEDVAQQLVSGKWIQKLSDWVQNTLLGNDLGELGRGPTLIAARVVNRVLGAVHPLTVNQSYFFRLAIAYTKRLSGRKAQENVDVVAMLNATLAPDRAFAATDTESIRMLDELFENAAPVDMENGKWGRTQAIKDEYGVIGEDLLEAWWEFQRLGTFKAFSDKSSIARALGITPGMTTEQMRNAFVDFFNKTTVSGSETTIALFDNLGRYYDEIELMIRQADPDTVSEMPRGRRLLHREVKAFANGKAPSKGSSPFKKRFYAEMKAGIEQGVVYTHGWRQNMTNSGSFARVLQAQREFNDAITNPLTGFAVSFEGLPGRVAALVDEIGFEDLEPNVQAYALKIKAKVAAIEDKYAKSWEKAGGDQELQDKALAIRNKELQTLSRGRGQTPTQQAKDPDAIMNNIDMLPGERFSYGPASPRKHNLIPLPSRVFWANNLDRKMTPGELSDLMNDHLWGLNHPAVTHIVGLDNIAYMKRQEIVQIKNAFRVIEDIVLRTSPRASDPEMRRYIDDNYGAINMSAVRALGAPGNLSLFGSRVANFWRLHSTGWDFAYPNTVGIPLFFRRPDYWAVMSWQSFKHIFFEGSAARYIENTPWIRENIAKNVRDGIDSGDVEVYLALSKGLGETGLGKVGEFDMGAWLNKIRTDANPAKRFLIESGQWSLRNTIKRFQRSYNIGAAINRAMIRQVYEPIYTTIDPVTGAARVHHAKLAQAVSQITGSLNVTDIGRSVSGKAIENFMVGLSPRLTRSVATMIFDAQRAALHIARTRDRDYFKFAITQGQAGKSPLQIAQDQAAAAGRQLTNAEIAAAAQLTRQALMFGNVGLMLTGLVSIFGATAWAYAMANGEDPEVAEQKIQNSMNPAEGKKFLAIQLTNGDWVGIGGFYRSLVQLQYKLLTGVANAMQGEYGPLSQFIDADRFDNPLLATYMNRGAPAITFGQKFIEGGINTISPIPVDAAPYDVIDNPVDMTIALGESFLPFAAQGYLFDNESAVSTGLGLFGLRTSTGTLGDATVHVARKILGIDLDTSRELSESWLKNMVLYPYVEQKWGLTSRANNSPLGLYMVRRDTLQADLMARLRNQWAAGASDNGLKRFFFEENRKMQGKLEEYRTAVGVQDLEMDEKNPIAVALKKWRDIYDSPEYTQALIDERSDILEALQQKVMQGFTQQQREAVVRAGSGSWIPREIYALLSIESKQRYAQSLMARKQWLAENAKNKEWSDFLAYILEENMMPSLAVNRGIVTTQ